MVIRKVSDSQYSTAEIEIGCGREIVAMSENLVSPDCRKMDFTVNGELKTFKRTSFLGIPGMAVFEWSEDA